MRITKSFIQAHLDYINSNALTENPISLGYSTKGDYILAMCTHNNDTLHLYRANTFRELEAFLTGFHSPHKLR